MISTTATAGGQHSANADDCARLWRTLTNEYLPDLRIQLEPRTDQEGRSSLWIFVVNDSLHTVDGKAMEHVWAMREYHNPLYLISVGQLFDLLISAYRRIDDFFTNGEPSAPARRVK